MSQTATQTSTYTTTDIEAVMRRMTADLVMIASSSGAVTEAHARDWAHDIEVLAKNGYLHSVDLTLYSHGVEKQATRFYVNESGGLANDRPGNARWPKVDGARLEIVLVHHAHYDKPAQEKLANKMKLPWTDTTVDISHSQLTQSGGREYSSNSYGMQRKDYI